MNLLHGPFGSGKYFERIWIQWISMKKHCAEPDFSTKQQTETTRDKSNTQITWILENETSDSEAFSFSKAGYTHKFRWHFPESCRISFLGGVHIAPQSLGDGHSSLMMCFHLPEKASIQAANAWLTVWNHLGSPAKLGWVDVCMIVNA